MDAGEIALVAVVVEGIGLLGTIVFVAYRVGSFTTSISGSIDRVGERMEDAHRDAMSKIGENKSRLDNHSERLRAAERDIARMGS